MRTLSTERLELRPWADSDLAPLAALNADPEVMQYMPRTLSRAESDALVAQACRALAARGFGLWALELRAEREFLGLVGLAEVTFAAPFAPSLEILWRLKRAAWGRGYATEAAHACLELAFATLAVPEVVAFTVPENRRSRAVMERLGMRRDPRDDFEHPRLPAGHLLRPHVLYRLAAAKWSPRVRSPSHT